LNQPVRNFAEFVAHEGVKGRLRALARDVAIRVLSLGRKVQGEWIRFPFWHHVFDDERKGFARQLRWMKNHGDFIGYDQAVGLLASKEKIGGRFFCLSFDDGFKNVYTNGLPILSEAGASAMIFLAASFVGSDLETDRERLLTFYPERRQLMEFLSWADCRAWLSAGMTLGSHTYSHAHLIDLDAEAVERELTLSKRLIEERLGVECAHFGCPWGHPGADYDMARDPGIAKVAGYHSFASTQRGANHAGGDVFALKRDHLLAEWGDHQLRYFLSGE
jgi:peptidoglycan/xylan/chitin deacetylase (PgdA/CDA1 family)